MKFLLVHARCDRIVSVVEGVCLIKLESKPTKQETLVPKSLFVNKFDIHVHSTCKEG
jgi:hypothetical protein